MLVYQGRLAKPSLDGIESVTTILPVQVHAGAPCVVIWRNGSSTPPTTDGTVNPPTDIFGSFETVLEKVDGQDVTFKAESYELELKFSGDQRSLSLSFQPKGGNQILTISMSLALGDPYESTSPECESIIAGGPVIIENERRGDLIAVVLRQKGEDESPKTLGAFIDWSWSSETAEIGIPAGVDTCYGQAGDNVPNHSKGCCFALSTQDHQFHGVLRKGEHSPLDLLLHFRPKDGEQAAWQAMQSFPVLDRHNDAMWAMVAQFSTARNTKVWNDTDEDATGIASCLVSVTIQQSGLKNDNYNKGMAGGGLFVALLGIGTLFTPPTLAAVSWAVGVAGLILAGQSIYDNFYEDPNKSCTRVLYPGDAVSRSANDNDSNEIVMLQAFMKGSSLNIVHYFVDKAGNGVYRVSDIIDGTTKRTVKPLFSFNFAEPHIINIYRYICIRWLTPTPTNDTAGIGLPDNGLPEPGSLVWFDREGKFLGFWPEKVEKEDDKREDVVDSFGTGLFDSNNKVIPTEMIMLVQGIKTQLSSNMRVSKLNDELYTPVLVMNNWKVSQTNDIVGNANTEEQVLNLIRGNRRKWHRGFQWDTKGGVYNFTSPKYYEKSWMTQSEGSHLFIPLTNEDWTYMSMIVKAP